MPQPTASPTARYRKTQVHPRARLNGQVLVHDENRLFLAPLSDLSVGGVFVKALVSIKQGASVKVVVRSPQLKDTLQAVGTVIRIENSDRKGLAVQFTELTDHARDVIQSGVFEIRLEKALKV